MAETGEKASALDLKNIKVNFSDKYISTTAATVENHDKKLIVSDDIFAIGEVIDALTKRIEALRLSALK